MAEPAPARPAIQTNRRAHQRFSLVGQAAILHLAGRSYPCTVRNLSSGGLMGIVYEAPLAEQCGQIELPTGQLMSGSILWTSDWKFGFAFDDEVDASGLLSSLRQDSAQRDRRAAPRIKVGCPAKLRVDNRFYFGRIVDISHAGARFATPGQLKKAGETILIAPDLPPLPSLVRWAKQGEFGLEFREQIPAAALRNWLAQREPDEPAGVLRRA